MIILSLRRSVGFKGKPHLKHLDERRKQQGGKLASSAVQEPASAERRY